MRPRLVEVQLPEENRRLLIEVEQLSGESDVGAKQSFPLANVLDSVRSLTKGLAPLLAELAPKKATIEFGMQLGIESGMLTAIIAKGTASANFKISLGWE